MKEKYKLYISFEYMRHTGEWGFGYEFYHPDLGWNGDTEEGFLQMINEIQDRSGFATISILFIKKIHTDDE